jgi:hypothetical protein
MWLAAGCTTASLIAALILLRSRRYSAPVAKSSVETAALLH